MSARVMICGAGDTRAQRETAKQLIRSIGMDAFDYTSAGASPLNDRSASNIASSKANVDRADLLIFIVADRYGEITWLHELTTATHLDRPYLMFISAGTYAILERSHEFSPAGIADPNLRQLVSVFGQLRDDPNRRIVPFADNFEPLLREALGGLVEQLLVERTVSKGLRGDYDQALEQLAMQDTWVKEATQRLDASANEIRLLNEEREHQARAIVDLDRSVHEERRSMMRSLALERRVQVLVGAIAATIFVLGCLAGTALDQNSQDMLSKSTGELTPGRGQTSSSALGSTASVDPGSLAPDGGG